MTIFVPFRGSGGLGTNTLASVLYILHIIYLATNEYRADAERRLGTFCASAQMRNFFGKISATRRRREGIPNVRERIDSEFRRKKIHDSLNLLVGYIRIVPSFPNRWNYLVKYNLFIISRRLSIERVLHFPIIFIIVLMPFNGVFCQSGGSNFRLAIPFRFLRESLAA